jgi:uncharacterized protein
VRPGRRIVWIVIGAALLLALGYGGVHWWSQREATAPQLTQAAPNCDSVTDPGLRGRVSDHADALTAAEEASLTDRLASFEQRSGHQTFVVTLRELGGQSSATVARCIGNRWGIGNAERDDGIIILLAMAERETRVAFGSGVSEAENDPRAAGVVEAMATRLSVGDIAGGLDSGITALERRFP